MQSGLLQEDGYDDKFRHGTSTAATIVAVIAVTGGIGVLQQPYAVRVGGWAAVFLIPLAGALSLYTANLLIRSLYSPIEYPRRCFEPWTSVPILL